MGEIPDIPSKMMILTVLTLIFLTFLSMAVGAPQGKLVPEGVVDSEKETETVLDSRVPTVLKSTVDAKFYPNRAAAPPHAQDLIGQYIFTTYHLLLKEIRNE